MCRLQNFFTPKSIIRRKIFWCIAGICICVICVIWVYVVSRFEMKGHYLLNKPGGDGDFRSIAEFEAGYLTYLAGMTMPVIGGILALFFIPGHDGNKWKTPAIISMYSFCSAIALVTIGYAIRNMWIVTGEGLSEPIAAIDMYFTGPLTAISYIIGIISLLVLSTCDLPAFSKRNS